MRVRREPQSLTCVRGFFVFGTNRHVGLLLWVISLVVGISHDFPSPGPGGKFFFVYFVLAGYCGAFFSNPFGRLLFLTLALPSSDILGFLLLLAHRLDIFYTINNKKYFFQDIKLISCINKRCRYPRYGCEWGLLCETDRLD